MKIAIVSPPSGPTGGPEVATRNLVNALVNRGVDVTCFAPGDFKFNSKHIATIERCFWKIKPKEKATKVLRRNILFESQLKVLAYSKDYDIIHCNLASFGYLLLKISGKPCVATYHRKITEPDHGQMVKAGVHTVAQSESHRKGLNTAAIIGNGVPVNEIKPSYKKGKYLIIIARLAESRGVDRAIKLAKLTGKKLIIIGRVGNTKKRKEYFNNKLSPHLDENITYVGEKTQLEIYKYLRNAEALLFPAQPETGSLTMCPLIIMEALAAGTPVISCPVNLGGKEIFSQEVAFFSNNLRSLTKAINNIDQFDRAACRKLAEKYFDSSLVADKYIELYRKILSKK